MKSALEALYVHNLNHIQNNGVWGYIHSSCSFKKKFLFYECFKIGLIVISQNNFSKIKMSEIQVPLNLLIPRLDGFPYSLKSNTKKCITQKAFCLKSALIGNNL